MEFPQRLATPRSSSRPSATAGVPQSTGSGSLNTPLKSTYHAWILMATAWVGPKSNVFVACNERRPAVEGNDLHVSV